jgi:hypothetical protein
MPSRAMAFVMQLGRTWFIMAVSSFLSHC